MSLPSEFTRDERAVFRKLTSRARIQRHLDETIGYNLEPKGATCYSPRLVLRHVSHMDRRL